MPTDWRVGIDISRQIIYKRIFIGNNMRHPTHSIALSVILGGFLFFQPAGNEQLVNSYLPGDQSFPCIAADSAGNCVVAWVSDSQDDGLPGIFARRCSPDGIPVSQEFQVNTLGGDEGEGAPHDHPAAALGGNGRLVFAWVNFWEDPVNGSVYARIYNNAGFPLGPEFMVNQYGPDFQGEPAVAMDGQGNIVFVWQSWEQDGDAFGIYARLYDPTGIPLGPEFRVNTFIQDNQMHPALAVESSGNFVVVWSSYDQDGDKTGVFARGFDHNGLPLGGEFQVNQTASGWQDHPDISADSMGDFVVCWHGQSATMEDYDIFARTLDRTGQLIGPEFKVNSTTEDWQVYPSVASDTQGNFCVAWQSRGQDGDSYGIFSRLFDVNGQPLGPEVQINTSTQSRQERPDVAMASARNFTTTWQSLHLMDSGWDVFIGRFEQNQKTFSLPRRGRFRIKSHAQQETIYSPDRRSTHD